MSTPGPNPYAPPSASLEPAAHGGPGGPPGELEAIRRRCIKREANIKSVGTLFLIGAALLGLGAIGGLIATVAGDVFTGLLIFVIAGGMATLYGFIARWLKQLEHRGRLAATILVGLGIAINVLSGIAEAVASGDPSQMPTTLGGSLGGMLIPGLILYALWSSPSETIFTAHYRDVVVPATPHIKYRSVVAIVLLVLLLLILVGAVVGVVLTA